MRCFLVSALYLTVTIGTGCQHLGRSKDSLPPCGAAHVSCGTGEEPCASACSTGGCVEPASEGYGLFGKAFCDRRLTEGTAFAPWQYTYNLCLAGSQFSNTILGGDPDESLSSRFGRAQEDGVGPVRYGLAPVTNVIVGPDHCRRCVEHDERRDKELWAW